MADTMPLIVVYDRGHCQAIISAACFGALSSNML